MNLRYSGYPVPIAEPALERIFLKDNQMRRSKNWRSKQTRIGNDLPIQMEGVTLSEANNLRSQQSRRKFPAVDSRNVLSPFFAWMKIAQEEVQEGQLL